MDRTPGHRSKSENLKKRRSKKECRKRANVFAALCICASQRYYSQEYLNRARLFVEKAKKEGYFEIGENDNGKRD